MPKRAQLLPTSELVDSWGRRNRKLADRNCLTCGEVFHPLRSASKYCSRPCMWANNGKNQRTVPESWWIDTKGYVQGFIRINGEKTRVKKHRWIMELHIGRPLLPSEDGAHSSLSNRLRAIRKAGAL